MLHAHRAGGRRTGCARSSIPRGPPGSVWPKLPRLLDDATAVHEEHERRALAGELAMLELAWREAEDIAGIADNLLVTKETEAFIERHRESDETR